MTPRLSIAGIGALALMCALTTTAHAQTYAFGVPTASMNVDIQSNGTIGVDYTFVFENREYASPIAVVDVGMPTDAYDLSTMTAAVDGRGVTDISKSTYIETGVQATLGDGEIARGATGTFTFHYAFRGLVFSDTTNDQLASFRITPTWFDPSVVEGTTHLAVLVHLPPGVRPEEAVWQQEPFSGTSLDPSDGRAVVAWNWDATHLTGPHLVGVSFPRRGMTGVVEITKLDLLLLWWAAPATVPVRVVVALLLLLAFCVVYYRFTGGTGFVPGLIVASLCAWLWWASSTAELLSIIVLPALLVAMELGMRRFKTHYLPPIASVEGGGIKRGLTAPEAAVLLEAPLSRVLTMVIFGMLKKGLITQVSASPLVVTVPVAYRGLSTDARRAAAAAAGVVVQEYEHAFLHAILTATVGASPDAVQALNVVDFKDAIHALVAVTADRVVAFDVDETKKYYRQIVERAWTEAKSVGEITQRDQVIDKNLEWLLVGDDFDHRFEGFGSSHVYYPIWMRPMAGPPASVGGGGGTPNLPAGTTAPSFGDVSASFAGWCSNVTGQVASSITPTSKGGVVDFSGFDHVTGEILKAMATNSGGGSGGGSHHSCACAGCACACACAGGGR